MKNKLVFPEGTPYSPNQRARIYDVWGDNSLGIKIPSRDEFPDLQVSSTYSGGHTGKDARYIVLTPKSEFQKYELVVADAGQVEIKSNPKIKTRKIYLRKEKHSLGGENPIDRYTLRTKVTPKNGGMTHNAVINVGLSNITFPMLNNKLEGRVWAHPDILAEEKENAKWIWSIETGYVRIAN